MSQPRRWIPGCDAIDIAIHELISVQSSLNMPPGARLPTNETGFLSEVDANVRHALEHLTAAIDALVSEKHFGGLNYLCSCSACKEARQRLQEQIRKELAGLGRE